MVTDDDTGLAPFYIRNLNGDCFYVETLDRAIAKFVADDGYRLTLKSSDGTEVIIRRASEGTPSEYINGETGYQANVVIRRPHG